MVSSNIDPESEIKIHFDKAAFQSRLVFWYQQSRRSLPWRTDFERTNNPFYVWLSEIMLQQTVINTVVPIYQRFTKEISDVKMLADTNEEHVRTLSRGLGYYRRFANLKKAAEILVKKHEMKWPTDYQEWLKLPGVGEYTAAAVTSIAFQRPHAVVDGNVERVLCRIFDIQLPPNLPWLKRRFRTTAQELIDPARPGDFNQGLMELGQRICTPINPICHSCPITESCLAHQNGHQHVAPMPKIKRKKPVDTQLQIFIFKYKDRIGLIERPVTAKFLKGTLGFMTSIKTQTEFNGDGIPIEKKLVKPAKPIGSIRHTITHHKITAHIFQVPLTRQVSTFRWIDFPNVERSLVANLDRKAWQLLQKTDQQ